METKAILNEIVKALKELDRKEREETFKQLARMKLGLPLQEVKPS